MLEVNTQVRTLPPFSDLYTETYFVEEVRTYADGQVAYILSDIGGFDIKYLEVV